MGLPSTSGRCYITTMPVKITISFSDPEDPDAFVSHYVNTHVPLVNDLPGLRAVEWGRALTNFDGSARGCPSSARSSSSPSRAANPLAP